MTGLASQKTNGTINAIPFPKGLDHLPLDIPPEEAAEIMNDELVSSPELIADLKRRAKTLLVGPVKSWPSYARRCWQPLIP